MLKRLVKELLNDEHQDLEFKTVHVKKTKRGPKVEMYEYTFITVDGKKITTYDNK